MSGGALWLQFCSAVSPLQHVVGWAVPVVVPIILAPVVTFFARAIPRKKKEHQEQENLLQTGGGDSGSDSGESFADAEEREFESETDRGHFLEESSPSLSQWITFEDNVRQSGSSSGKGGRCDSDPDAAELFADAEEEGLDSPAGLGEQCGPEIRWCISPTPGEAVMAWDDAEDDGQVDVLIAGEATWKAGGERRRKNVSNSRKREGHLEGRVAGSGSPVESDRYVEPPSPAVGPRACCIAWPRKRGTSSSARTRSGYERLPSLASCPEIATASDDEGTKNKHPLLPAKKYLSGSSPEFGTDVTAPRLKSKRKRSKCAQAYGSIPCRGDAWGYKVTDLYV